MARTTPEMRKTQLLAELKAGHCSLRRLAAGHWQITPPPGRQTGARFLAVSRSAEALLAEGKISLAVGGRARLTDLGRLAIKKARQDHYADQHRSLAHRSLQDGSPVRVNLAESPLQWLASRKDCQGRRFLSACEIEAGERLRRDFTLAGLTPQVTARWSMPQDKGGGAAGVTYSDTVVAARQRLSRACAALGPDLSGLLLDICGFLKGLQEVESARGWPVRTAKVVLKLGLAQLARHYGLSDTVTARPHQPIRQWGAADYRPVQDLSGSKGRIATDPLDHGPQSV